MEFAGASDMDGKPEGVSERERANQLQATPVATAKPARRGG